MWCSSFWSVWAEYCSSVPEIFHRLYWLLYLCREHQLLMIFVMITFWGMKCFKSILLCTSMKQFVVLSSREQHRLHLLSLQASFYVLFFMIAILPCGITGRVPGPIPAANIHVSSSSQGSYVSIWGFVILVKGISVHLQCSEDVPPYYQHTF